MGIHIASCFMQNIQSVQKLSTKIRNGIKKRINNSNKTIEDDCKFFILLSTIKI